MRCKNNSTVGKNPANNAKKPYVSINIPNIAHFINTIINPRIKQNAPLWFRGFTKNFTVLRGPIVVVTPDRNMRLPIANNARSKKRTTPKVVKPHPNTIKPMPISVRDSHNRRQYTPSTHEGRRIGLTEWVKLYSTNGKKKHIRASSSKNTGSRKKLSHVFAVRKSKSKTESVAHFFCRPFSQSECSFLKVVYVVLRNK